MLLQNPILHRFHALTGLFELLLRLDTFVDFDLFLFLFQVGPEIASFTMASLLHKTMLEPINVDNLDLFVVASSLDF